MASLAHRRAAPDEAQLRAWLHYVIDAAIDMLDALDAPAEDLEDSEAGCE